MHNTTKYLVPVTSSERNGHMYQTPIFRLPGKTLTLARLSKKARMAKLLLEQNAHQISGGSHGRPGGLPSLLLQVPPGSGVVPYDLLVVAEDGPGRGVWQLHQRVGVNRRPLLVLFHVQQMPPIAHLRGVRDGRQAWACNHLQK
eukprot:scaffold9639_cov19-Prasinocladus_malaysianus.AAC.1